MNETVYLFALSVPYLLEQLIADRSGRPTPTPVTPPPQEKRS
jgi:hypothetical protein